MEWETLKTLLVVCPMIFAAGFIDSIAGGGGLISLPAYLFAGLPIHFAYGTNKFSSTFGTIFSTFRYIKSGQVHLKSALISAVGALIGSFLGAKLALALDEKFLKYFLIVMLPVVAIIVLIKRNFGDEDRTFDISEIRVLVLSFLSGLIIGAYDGFFGPGTGTFLILAYTGLIGFSLVKASGNAKIVNLASNISALATFAAHGKIVYMIGIPAIIFGIAGNWIGSGLALKNGARIIKPIFIGVLLLLFGTVAYDIFK